MSAQDDPATAGKRQGSEVANRPQLWRWIVLSFFVASVAGAAFFANTMTGMLLIDGYHAFPQMIRDLGIWGQAGIIALMIIHCFVPFPAEFVAFAAGSIYGVFYGTILTWTGAMIGAMLSFSLTRVLGQSILRWVLTARQKQMLDHWTDDQGAMTLLVSRFIPVIAFNLINYAAGLTRVSWWTFFWTTGVGIFPLTALMVYLGAQARDFSWQWLVILSAICIAIMGLLHWYRRGMEG